MQMINTIVLILLMGAKLDFIPIINQVFNGSYRDFTYQWYREIGSIYVTTMIILMFQGVIELIIQVIQLRIKKWMD